MDYNDIIEELNCNGKSIEEVVDLLIESPNGIEKIYTFIEKYKDETEEIRVEINNARNEYEHELTKLNNIKRNYEQKINQNIEDFNNINNEITNYGPFVQSSDSEKLLQIESELNKLNKTETLLNGQLSHKDFLRKEELLHEKASLLKDKKDYQKLKTEIFKDYNNSMKEIENIEKQKKHIIDESVKKSIELHRNQGTYRKKLKQYNSLFELLRDKLLKEKKQLDDKYIEIVDEYNKKIVSKDLNTIANYGKTYNNVVIEINDFYKKNEYNFKLLGINLTKPTITNDEKVVNEFENKAEEVVDEQVNDSVETEEIEEIIENKEEQKDNSNEVIVKEDEQKEESTDKVEKQDDNLEKKQDINPVLWYDKYKDEIVNNNPDLTDEQIVQLVDYVEQLKQEFISLFASFRRIDYDKSKIQEALNNSVKLVEQKKFLMLESNKEKSEESEEKTR